MPSGSEFKIKKLERGPLQRFKNQNLLIKKFGEVGIQVYKAITGKRTTEQLRSDLGIDAALFNDILDYMKDAGMVELEPLEGAGSKGQGEAEVETPASEEKESEEKQSEEKARELEGVLPDGEAPVTEESPPLTEEPPSFEPKVKPKPKPKKKPSEETEENDEIKPIMFGESEKQEEEPAEGNEETAEGETSGEGEQEPAGEETKNEEESESIQPVEEEQPAEESTEELEIESSQESEATSEEPSSEETTEAASEAEETEQSTEQEPSTEEKDELELSSLESPPADEAESDLSPVEKIISEKYGDLGLTVYALIDGQRTAEEIMKETGLTEAKLVEILDFMDEQGIIKLDYPKGKPAAAEQPSTFGRSGAAPSSVTTSAPTEESKKPDTFAPMAEGEGILDESRAVPSPVELPIKAPLDLMKSVQLKAKIMLKYSNKGSKVYDMVDGKNDILDIVSKLDIPLYDVEAILKFMMENGMLLLKPLTRADVRKKYGDDGYSVYKVYGKEGLMLYELIGKEMTIRQMADKITKDRSKIVDMFIFIHKVLGIELPIDRTMLAKQLGI